jgi:hypothetical protein
MADTGTASNDGGWGGAASSIFDTLVNTAGSAYAANQQAATAQAAQQANASQSALVTNSQTFQAGLTAQTYQIIGIGIIAMVGLVLALRYAKG